MFFAGVFVLGQILYLDGVRLFGNKLEELTDVLNNKEIRIRLPLEELDLLWEAVPDAGQSEDAMSDDE